MATLPVQRTWTVGETVTAAMFNDDLRDAVNFLLNPAMALVANGAIALANNTDTYMTFSSETYDSDAIHSTTTNPGRLTATITGKWRITAYAEYAANVGGNSRHLFVRHNGATVLRRTIQAPVLGGHATSMIQTFEYHLALNDYIEMGAYQDSGGVLNVTPDLGMTWIGVG